MNPYNKPNIIPASTVMNATINSSPQQIWSGFIYAIQIVFTGTPTGSFKLQASNDSATPALGLPSGTQTAANGPTHWTDISGSPTAVTAAGNVMWSVSDPGYNWVRVVYTDSSSGASTAIITSSTMNSKGI